MLNIKILNNTAYIYRDGAAILVQSVHPETSLPFSSAIDAWGWVVECGWWARLQADKVEALTLGAEAARRRALVSVVGTDNPEQVRVYEEKYAEAQAWTANSADPTPILSAEAAETGETVSALAPVVIIEFEVAKSTLAVKYGRIEGIRRNAKAAILGIDASTPAAAADLETIRWEF